jgi:AraC family transcriptional regulator of adaptative response/methylated-DNA-[protein]-cysteine methyltransferase
MKALKESYIKTPIGEVIAIANEEKLLLLEFVDCRGIEGEIERLKKQTKSSIEPGTNKVLQSIEKELREYFAGKLKTFKTPLALSGTSFQESVWRALNKIPYGETRSYAQVAQSLGKPTAFRAVANANGANQLAIVIPCHRVINSNGELGGYGGHVHRKEWLLKHEAQG